MTWQQSVLTQRLPMPSQQISEPKQQAVTKAANNIAKLFTPIGKKEEKK